MRADRTFRRHGGALLVEEVPLARIAAQVGTPAYVYSTAAVEGALDAVGDAFRGLPHLVCYSVKANPCRAILELVQRRGAGFDVVSGGELYRVLMAGADLSKVVFSGVGKTEAEIAFALEAGILMLNVESEEELGQVARVARRLGKVAPVALRVNPGIDARTHPSVATGLAASKFGVPLGRAAELYRREKRNRSLALVGLDCHIGSQITELAPVRSAVRRMAALFRTLKAEGLPLRLLDVGGGLGISYRGEAAPTPARYARAVAEAAGELAGGALVLEPGRLVVGGAGVLLTRVLYCKASSARRWIIVDAGMNDLVRPALYGAKHDIVPVERRVGQAAPVAVAGPLCESTDVFAERALLPPVRPGDCLAIMTAGAYGMSMASTYNSRPRPPEVLVAGRGFRVVRERESWDDLVRAEWPRSPRGQSAQRTRGAR